MNNASFPTLTIIHSQFFSINYFAKKFISVVQNSGTTGSQRLILLLHHFPELTPALFWLMVDCSKRNIFLYTIHFPLTSGLSCLEDVAKVELVSAWWSMWKIFQIKDL